MAKITRMELCPRNGRKSFHGKAVVVSNGKDIALFSYGAPVCWTDCKLVLHRTWGGWSAKTGEHVKSFCDEFGVPYKGKRDWDKMDVEAVPKWVKDKCVV